MRALELPFNLRTAYNFLVDKDPSQENARQCARPSSRQRTFTLVQHFETFNPGVAKEPQPQSDVLNFNSGALTFQLRAWTNRYEDRVQVRSDLAAAVDEALSRESISIP